MQKKRGNKYKEAAANLERIEKILPQPKERTSQRVKQKPKEWFDSTTWETKQNSKLLTREGFFNALTMASTPILEPSVKGMTQTAE